ncbi:unnamed protein product [Mytilus coruscus]|uniref:Mab-21-like HhH/H2TH-like domain-containing protein n=1 Tax=Mytilus coruscus TaxID=42192 RepID=A0A6J8BSP0_MYTCO|nr:unnamed protein product [Mytilus coruscus]
MRLMNAVRDRVSSDKDLTEITSGSFGEGLEMRSSDLDSMRVLHCFEVFEKEKPCFYPNITYFSMEIDDVKPCYTQLILEHVDYGNSRLVFSLCEDQNGKTYYSSILVKRWLMDYYTYIIHGPCLTDKIGLQDIAMGLHCKTWVSSAVQWITRSNNSWPSHDIKQKNNMFENKIEGRAREILLDTLNTLHSYGWRCILFSDQISNFAVEMRNFHLLPEVVHVKDVEKILKSILLHGINNAIAMTEPYVFNNIMLSIVSYKQSSIKHLFKYFMSKVCQRRVQYMPMKSNNKYQYKEYKTCLSSLLQGVYHDAVSGWLMVASLFYKTKQYIKALHVIMYSLSNCTTEKLHLYMNMADSHYQLLKQQTFQKKNFVSLMKTMFVDVIMFGMTSTLIPDEVQIHHSNRMHIYSCTAYAYFLLFLCYYHLNDVRKCQDSLRGLQLVINEDF